MARLRLHFEKTLLKEFPLSRGGLTIGRLPDNDIQVDNPAVSSHHATVYWDSDHFVLKDNGSFNGTYINNERITTHVLRDNDQVLIGKHTLVFKAEPLQEVAPAVAHAAKQQVPTIDSTVMLDTKKARELMLQSSGKIQSSPVEDAPGASSSSLRVANFRLGVLSVISGKADQLTYVLTSKLTVIGKSEMASIRLKGWFAPGVASSISRRDDKYFITPATKTHKVRVNGHPISGQWQLNAGDMIKVGKLTMTFNYS